MKNLVRILFEVKFQIVLGIDEANLGIVRHSRRDSGSESL